MIKKPVYNYYFKKALDKEIIKQENIIRNIDTQILESEAELSVQFLKKEFFEKTFYMPTLLRTLNIIKTMNNTLPDIERSSYE